MTPQRTKEFDIRKVLGPSPFEVGRSFFMSFMNLVFISGVIAMPLSILLIQRWLQNYASHLNLSPWNPLLAFIFVTRIISLTIICHIRYVSHLNLTDTLRDEWSG
jgi:putative ABC transport system permease protein